MCKLIIVIDGEAVEVNSVTDNGFGGYYIDTDAGEFVVFDSHESAGQASRNYWEDMAENDKSEFKCMVGEDCLANWCLSEFDGPGTAKVQSLSDWLDLWLDTPEEHWASYDGTEIEGVQCNRNLLIELAMESKNKDYIVMYRHN